jgi:hypothetical protein
LGFLTALVFAGVTVTLTKQLPFLIATSLPAMTLHILFDDFATVSVTTAFAETAILICFAKAVLDNFCFSVMTGCAAAGFGAGTGTTAGSSEPEGVFGVAGVTEFDDDDADPVPATLVAETVNV